MIECSSGSVPYMYLEFSVHNMRRRLLSKDIVCVELSQEERQCACYRCYERRVT